jgi:hypothetical protein
MNKEQLNRWIELCEKGHGQTVAQEMKIYVIQEQPKGLQVVAWIVESEDQRGQLSTWVSMDRKRHMESHDSLNPIVELVTLQSATTHAEQVRAETIEECAALGESMIEGDSPHLPQVTANDVIEAIRALLSAPVVKAGGVPAKDESIQITLRQAHSLVGFFGGYDAEVTVAEYKKGLLAYCTDYPDEGGHYLGDTEVDDDLAVHGEPVVKAEQLAAGQVPDDVARNDRRYRRLQVLGAAPCGSVNLLEGTVLRFQGLDAFIDADLRSHASRGEVAPVPGTVGQEVKP